MVGNVKYRKLSTKYFSSAEKYGRKCFECDFIKSISIGKKNDLSGNIHHLRYSMLFSNVIFPEPPSTGRFCGLGGVGEKVVDVLGKPPEACFTCLLLILSYGKNWLLAGRPNFQGQL